MSRIEIYAADYDFDRETLSAAVLLFFIDRRTAEMDAGKKAERAADISSVPVVWRRDLVTDALWLNPGPAALEALYRLGGNQALFKPIAEQALALGV